MAKILVVEDNDMLNQAYQLMLSHHGYTVAAAFNGEEGLDKAASFEPDVILLDYLMPVLDGKGFLLKYRPKDHPNVKVLLLTNLDEEAKIDEAFDLGITDYLLKASFSPQQLTEQIEAALTA